MQAQPMTFTITALVSSGIGFLGFFIGVGLLITLVRNLGLSQWMKVALIGVLIMMSAGLFAMVVPMLMARVSGTGAIYQLYLLIAGFRTIGMGLFVVGISGTLFDVRNQLRIAHAMLNKPAPDDLS